MDLHMTILADAGIPMIFIQMPAMVCALIPVILVETIVLSRKLSLGFSAALRGSASANIVSTLVGVPIAWCLMLGIEFSQYPVYVLGQKLGWNFNAPLFRIIGFVLSVSWLPPLCAGNRWLIPLAAALLLAPCFFVSVWIESKMCFRTWKHIEWRLLHRAVVAANLISYLCLTIVALACTWNKYYSPPKIENVTTANLIKEENIPIHSSSRVFGALWFSSILITHLAFGREPGLAGLFGAQQHRLTDSEAPFTRRAIPSAREQ
jgi:hypothetical protein